MKHEWEGGKVEISVKEYKLLTEKVEEAKFALNYLQKAIRNTKPVFEDNEKVIVLNLDDADRKVIDYALSKLEER